MELDLSQYTNEESDIEILYQDEYVIGINKPHGLLVHKTRIAKDATRFALQEVRNLIDAHVYPVHRLDRKTSGVLLLAKTKTDNSALQEMFRERKVHKEYIAIVRGYTPDLLEIDYDLTSPSGKVQSAQTKLETLERYELPLPSYKYETSRFSLVRLTPSTGRYHQLRKHMAHIRHPILGDRPHGCNKQNRIWKERFGMDTMLLHAEKIECTYPKSHNLKIVANPMVIFLKVKEMMKCGGIAGAT